MGRAAAVVLELGPLEEACPLGLAPTSSTTAMLALGDALALVASRMRNFGRDDFARFHPAGSLGQKLSKVEHHMRPLVQCRVASEDLTVREVLVCGSMPGRRTGATMLVDAEGKLSGIFTDSDLARLFEQRRDHSLDRPVSSVMTRNPLTAAAGGMMIEAVALLAKRKISELPVVDAAGRPLGLIDVTDVVGLLPAEESGGRFAGAEAAARPAACFPGSRTPPHERPERCQAIELILSDVDGVLTDGRILLDNQGIEAKSFHIRDGLGIRLWQRAGCRFGLVSAAQFAQREDAGGGSGH